MFVSSNLLLSLILLEIIGFLVLFLLGVLCFGGLSGHLLLLLFCLFVMEGVIALSGLISLVSFVGSDYLRASSILKF